MVTRRTSIGYALVVFQLETVGTGVHVFRLTFTILEDLPVGAFFRGDIDLGSDFPYYFRYIFAFDDFNINISDTLVFLATEARITFTTGSAGTVVPTGPAIFRTEIGFHQADIASSTVISITTLSAIGVTSGAVIGIGITNQSLGAGAEGTTLQNFAHIAVEITGEAGIAGAIFVAGSRDGSSASVGAAVGAALFAEASSDGTAFLDADPVIGAVEPILTDAAHSPAAIVATFFVAAIGLADLADVDFEVIFRAGINVTFKTDGAVAA